MKKSYRAEPSDVWSCGIVLVAMLSGGEPSVIFILFFFPVKYFKLLSENA